MNEEKPKVMPKFISTKGIVVEQFNATPRAKILRIKFSGIEDFSFSEGQFANLSIDSIKDSEGRIIKRSYSIASSSLEKNYLEFAYTVKEGQEPSFTMPLSKLKKGDEIGIQAAFGLFKLEQPFEKKITFIGAGAGITPLMSMIRTLIKKEAHSEIELYYGFRCPSDFIYEKELKEFSNKKNFKLFTAISCKEHEHKEWNGLQGRITNILEEKLPSSDGRKIYICGPPQMVADTISILEKKSYSKEQIKKEEW